MSDHPASPSAAGNVSGQSTPASVTAKAIARSPGEQRPTKPPLTTAGEVMLWLFGILLPVGTIVLEATQHMCAETFFDPIPTWWQLALAVLVPGANLATWFAIVRRRTTWLPRVAHLNAFALGVSAVYVALFLPLTPIAVVAVVVYGFGLLPLTPLISFLALLHARRALRRTRTSSTRLPKVWIGFAAGVAALALPHAHDFATGKMLALAASKDPTSSQRGVGLLRTFGSRDSLLRACYSTNDWSRTVGNMWGNFFPVSGTGSGIATEAAMAIYYRVTGEPFNSVPAPTSVALGRRGLGMWNFDDALGGSKVASKVAGLSMESSRLDGKVESAAGTSYVEWTMVFKNIARNQSEARAQIELPPGAVVSRLTLWIEGEPREAAFGGRGQVRAAYQEVAVQQRRDPVLVTTCGPDRVLMQCFPVQPNGGEMKVRVGITAPLRLTGERAGAVLLPRFLETNFEQAKDFAHDVWLESDQPLNGAGLTARLSLSDEKLRGTPTFQTTLPGQAAERWTDDPTDPAFVIHQTVRRAVPNVPSRVIFVVDGSKAMASELPVIADALRKMPAGRDFAVVFAGDAAEVVEAGRDATKISAALRLRKATGGRDNLPALERAWDMAAAEPGGAIVWLHGPQPVLLSSVERLLQRTERDPHPPLIYDVAKGAGPNRIIEKLDRFRGIRSVREGTDLAANLDYLLALWRGEPAEFTLIRERLPRTEATPPPTPGGTHIARLWGFGEVDRLTTASEPGALERAIKLALRLQLVTPVSGAVVLERKEQYDRHGLTPADPATVPTIPEPGTALLVLLGGGALLLCRRRSHRTAAASVA